MSQRTLIERLRTNPMGLETVAADRIEELERQNAGLLLALQEVIRWAPSSSQAGKIAADAIDAASRPTAANAGGQDVVALLLQVAGAAEEALDGTEENEHGLVMPRAEFERISHCLDALDALPDDRPGYTLSAAAKAAWALRDRPAAANAGDLNDLTPYLRQYMHNDGSSLVFGYDKAGVDRLVASLQAKANPTFEAADDLIAWLDTLHATEDGVITNRKWDIAQKAIAALSQSAQSQEKGGAT